MKTNKKLIDLAYSEINCDFFVCVPNFVFSLKEDPPVHIQFKLSKI